MAIDIIQLPPDSTGKKVAARSYTESAQTVYAQAGYLTTDTAAGNPAVVVNAMPGATDYALVTRAFFVGAPFTVQTPANLTAVSSSTATSLDRAGNVMLTIKGTYGGATLPIYVFEGSDDAGTTWFPISAVREDILVRENGGNLAANTSRSWTIDTTGWTQVRFRVTTWGTPTGAIVCRWSPGALAYEPPVTHVPAVRTNFSAHVLNETFTTSDAIIGTTLVTTRDYVAAAAVVSATVTAGKRLRLTGWTYTVRNPGTTHVGGIFRLRVNPTGAAVIGSPLVAEIGTGSHPGTNVANTAWSMSQTFPDGGIELSGTNQFTLSRQGTATAGNDVVIYGYEY